MLTSFLEEDIGTGDITSNSVVPADLRAKAEIICKSRTPALVCGLEEASMIFDLCHCATRALVKDGAQVRKGKRVMEVLGTARDILKAERTALNLLTRMSGISTETRRLAKTAKGFKIQATRKTAPGLRYFDKKAVVVGGGGSHRMRLDEMVLIKDNHIIAAGSPAACINNARKQVGRSAKIECEVKNKAEAIAAISAGAEIIMLDNFTPGEARKTIQALARAGLRKRVEIEISGGVDARNIRQYARARPDFISVGYITHSPRAVDFSLEIMRIN